jgi:hypothetical protein
MRYGDRLTASYRWDLFLNFEFKKAAQQNRTAFLNFEF